MPYPEQLLPKVEYREEISVDELIGTSPDSYYLIRLSKVAIQDPNNIKIREICDPTKDFIGLSTNLLGIFELLHLPLRPLSRPRPDYWIKSDGSISAASISYDEIAERNPIFIKINQLHDQHLPATKHIGQNSITISLKVHIKHKPTKPNYWHFEARVFGEDMQEFDRDRLPDWVKNPIKKLLEIDICHKASGLPPATFAIIPNQLYVDP